MRKPSVTTVIACLALFFSLAGTGLAASKYIITSTHQIKPSVLKALRGKRGPAGLPGALGATGAAGVFSTSDLTVAQGPTESLCVFGGGSCGTAESIAVCPTGVAVSGGWLGDMPNGVVASNSLDGPTQWEITMNNEGPIAGTFNAFVVCAS
jgi:hypothetical protein